MPSIQQIPNLLATKSVAQSVRPADQNAPPFTLDGFSRIEGNKAADNSTSKQSSYSDMGGLSERTPLAIAKNPALSSQLLKNLLSDEVITQLRASGNGALAEQLLDLAKAIFLDGENLPGEMQSQFEEATIFKGELFDALRGLMGQSDQMRTAIASVLKAYSQSQSAADILNTLSGNFSYLSQLFAQNGDLSQRLSQLSAQFAEDGAAQNFSALKTLAQGLLTEMNQSVLANDTTRSLSSLVIHNLSRYNDNPTLLAQSMDKLLDLVDDEVQAAQLKSIFTRLLFSGEKNTEQVSHGTASHTQPKVAIGFSRAAEFLSRNLSQPSFVDALVQGGLSDKLANVISQLRDGQIGGMDALKAALSSILSGDEAALVSSRLMRELGQMSDLETLIGNLNLLLRNMPEDNVRQSMFDVFMGAINTLRDSDELRMTAQQNFDTSSPMKALAEFLQNNIHRDAPSITGFSAGAMVQSLLTAPGAYTPLLHMLLPAEYKDKQAFGELWVDNNEESLGKDSYHFFLTFNVEEVGSFELDLYAYGSELSASLLCPPDYIEHFEGMALNIAKVCSKSGFSLGTLNISPLQKQKDLLEVFPKLSQRRLGLDVKV